MDINHTPAESTAAQQPVQRIQIRPMSAQTLEAVARVECEVFPHPWSLESLAAELQNPLAVFNVAELDGVVAGYAGMHHVLDEGYITNIAVLKPYRRQAVGLALVNAFLAYGKKHAMRVITLEVRPSNEAAISLYRKLGFEQAGVRRRFYTDPTEDALLMSRTFP